MPSASTSHPQKPSKLETSSAANELDDADSDDMPPTDDEYYRHQAERQEKILAELKSKMDSDELARADQRAHSGITSGETSNIRSDVYGVMSPTLCGGHGGLRQRGVSGGGHNDPMSETACVVCELALTTDSSNPMDLTIRCARCGTAMHASCGEPVTQPDGSVKICCSSYCDA